MSPLTITSAGGPAALVETLASYISRVYSEFGKILSREVQENLDAWEEKVEPQLGLSREHAAISAAVLQQLALGVIALEFGAVLFDRGPHMARPRLAEIAQAVLGVVLVVVFCNQLIPIAALQPHARAVGGAAGVAHPAAAVAHHADHRLRSLLLLRGVAGRAAGEPGRGSSAAMWRRCSKPAKKRAFWKRTDRDLVRSAVEFGDKLVREVMTPRPSVFAVPESTTLEQFLELLREHNFSRVPVYSDSLDNITGIAFAHDLLQITDEEARTRTVASIQRPAAFVPETKRGYELLREMQREKQHMRIVIDEYGGVAGLVTIEDLLEQIVGNIRDEHEDDVAGRRAAARAGRHLAGAGQFSCRSVGRSLRRAGGSGRYIRSHDAGRPGERNRGTHSAARRSGDARSGRAAHRGGCFDRSARGAAAGFPAAC